MTADQGTEAKKRLLYLDCIGGVSGDMILASLIDMGFPIEVIESAVSKLPLSGYRISTTREQRNSISATRFAVETDGSKQPHRRFVDIEKMIQDADLSEEVKSLASEIFRIIAEAEARVHGSSLQDVHFHEVGAVDSIVDIVGAASALAHINARVVCSPIPLGKGTVHTAHGVLPVPAPATMIILEGVPVEGTEIDAELTTPTGAAVVKAVASEFGLIPPMVPEKSGFGAGERNHPKRPGLLRAVLGRELEVAPGRDGSSCFVIEANIDDITGEMAGEAIDRLLDAGVLDAWAEPIHMKKGRPAIRMGVLCRSENLHRVAAMVLENTTTIGLRYHAVGRIEMNRSIHTVQTEFGPVRVKVARGPGGSANAAPEFDDCRRAAAEHGVSIKRVVAVAAGLAQKLLE